MVEPPVALVIVISTVSVDVPDAGVITGAAACCEYMEEVTELGLIPPKNALAFMVVFVEQVTGMPAVYNEEDVVGVELSSE